MNRTVLLILGLLIILAAVVGVILLSQTGGQPPAATAEPAGNTTPEVITTAATPEPEPETQIQVVIAVQEIRRGTIIDSTMVDTRNFDEDFEFATTFSSVEDVIGRVARTDIFREEIIVDSKVVDSRDVLAAEGSDAALLVPRDRVLIAVPMDRLTSIAYAIQPGDTVDIIISFLFVDVDPAFQSREPNAFTFINPIRNDDGTFSLGITEDAVVVEGRFDTRVVPNVGTVPVVVGPSEEPRPRLATQRTIQNARVIHVGDFPNNGVLFPTPTRRPADDATPQPAAARPAAAETAVPTEVVRPDIVALAVTPQEAVMITWFVEAGIPINFVLRSPTATSLAETDPVTLDYIMNRYRIALPELLPYTIEPAIRSIRQLDVGDRISLSDDVNTGE